MWPAALEPLRQLARTRSASQVQVVQWRWAGCRDRPDCCLPLQLEVTDGELPESVTISSLLPDACFHITVEDYRDGRVLGTVHSIAAFACRHGTRVRGNRQLAFVDEIAALCRVRWARLGDAARVGRRPLAALHFRRDGRTWYEAHGWAPTTPDVLTPTARGPNLARHARRLRREYRAAVRQAGRTSTAQLARLLPTDMVRIY